MQSKRQILRELQDITDQLAKITRIALVLGAELYATDPDNTLFVEGPIEPAALKEIKRLAKLKAPIRQDPDAVAATVQARREPWYKRLWAFLITPLF